jgi:hypothetical protein
VKKMKVRIEGGVKLKVENIEFNPLSPSQHLYLASLSSDPDPVKVRCLYCED